MPQTLPHHVDELTDLVDGVRTAVTVHAAGLVAEQRLGSPDDYCGHILHVEPDGSFSIITLIWRPGQIHDHVNQVAFGVEHEDLFDAELNLISHNKSHVGDVRGFAPPGDIHRVRNQRDDGDLPPHLAAPTTLASVPAPAATTADLDQYRKRNQRPDL